MGWEVRGRRWYYYQPARVGGKPRRLYWGAGTIGRLHELFTRHERRERAKRRARARERAAEVAALGAGLRDLLGRVRQLVRAARLLGGEYQHKGTWRRRGMSGNQRARERAADDRPVGDGDVEAWLHELNARANRGDRTALAEIRILLDRHPAVWQGVGDQGAVQAGRWADLLADHQALGRECLTRHLEKWKADLRGATPTPLEAAAADAAGVAWLAVRYAELDLTTAPEGRRAAAAGRLTAANRQLQEGLKLVASVRAGAAGAVSPPAPAAVPAASGPRLFAPTGS